MKICYVGDNLYGEYALIRISNKLDFEYIDIKNRNTEIDFSNGVMIDDIFENVIKENADVYFIDLDLFVDTEEIIVKGIYSIKEAVNSKIVIHAPQYNEDSKILLDLKALGIVDIVTAAENQGYIEEGFITALNSRKSEEFSEETQEELLNEREQEADNILQQLPNLKEIEEEPSEITELIKERMVNTLKIAVVGSKRGIGATTVAIQMVKHFNTQNEGCAAYIEMNNHGYVERLHEYFDYERYDKKLSMCSIGGIPLFSDSKKLPQILQKGYSFCIYDYGSFSSASDLPGIYEKDIIVLVGGIKANEIKETTDAIEEFSSQRNIYYMMNFIPKRNREVVKEFMEEDMSKTYFIEATCDPFILVPDNGKIFDSMIRNMQKPVKKVRSGKLRRIFK